MCKDNDTASIEIEYYGKKFRTEFSNGLTTSELVEDVIAPLIISMGYFPTNVYEALGMVETLDIIKRALSDEGV